MRWYVLTSADPEPVPFSVPSFCRRSVSFWMLTLVVVLGQVAREEVP